MQTDKKTDRKKFLFWTAAVSSVFILPSFLRGKNKKKAETVKMLTQDGRLVEIDIKHIPAKKSRISMEGIHNWITKK